LAELVQEALHSARAEVARRLQVAELPLSVKIRRTLIEPSEGTGWQSRQRRFRLVPYIWIRYSVALPTRLCLIDCLDCVTSCSR
jgi:hypothetical protein